MKSRSGAVPREIGGDAVDEAVIGGLVFRSDGDHGRRELPAVWQQRFCKYESQSRTDGEAGDSQNEEGFIVRKEPDRDGGHRHRREGKEPHAKQVGDYADEPRERRCGGPTFEPRGRIAGRRRIR